MHIVASLSASDVHGVLKIVIEKEKGEERGKGGGKKGDAHYLSG